MRRSVSALPLLLLVAALLGLPACRRTTAARSAPPESPRDARELALRRAAVWHEPAIPIAQVDLSHNPGGHGGFADTDEVECRFVQKPVDGTTPKFYCETTSGVVKVKYGAINPELPAEVAATRLLGALGFPVDRMYVVRSVRCAGCPPDPFAALRCVGSGSPASVCLAGSNPDRVVIFPAATIERPLEGSKIESVKDEGWSWYELDRIDPRAGGAPRAQVDALRLMAVLLAHWDNKGPNQRLLCPEGVGERQGACAAPVAMIQDLGATFGPLKIDLPNWRQSAIWADPRTCVATMKALPYSGSTFGEQSISEEGRQFALQLLRQLTPAQLRGLFEGSGVTRFSHVYAAAHDPAAWAEAFAAKVAAIANAGPCPSAASLAR